jgi:hypothetical protein
MFDYDTKEKEHQKTRQSDLYSGKAPRTNQIASCFDALSITCIIFYMVHRHFHAFLLHETCHIFHS